MRWPPPEYWPNREISRQVLCKPHRWHIQETGTGSSIILLHGAGGSTHSFRDVIPKLAKTHRVVAIDMPGQGLTQLGARHRCGLDSMAQDIASLIAQEAWKPVALVGHSAGGALALRLSQLLHPQPMVIGINPALGHFQGLAGLLFPIMAKLLALTPGIAGFFSRSANNPERVRSLIEGTGSHLSDDGLSLYRKLVGDKGHVDATLLMMAQWSLDGLLDDLKGLQASTLLIAAEMDEAVPPEVSENAARTMPNAELKRLRNLGHLAHEEDPALIAQMISAFATKPKTEPA